MISMIRSGAIGFIILAGAQHCTSASWRDWIPFSGRPSRLTPLQELDKAIQSGDLKRVKLMTSELTLEEQRKLAEELKKQDPTQEVLPLEPEEERIVRDVAPHLRLDRIGAQQWAELAHRAANLGHLKIANHLEILATEADRLTRASEAMLAKAVEPIRRALAPVLEGAREIGVQAGLVRPEVSKETELVLDSLNTILRNLEQSREYLKTCTQQGITRTMNVQDCVDYMHTKQQELQEIAIYWNSYEAFESMLRSGTQLKELELLYEHPALL